MGVDFKQIDCDRWNEIPSAVIDAIRDLDTRVIPLQNESGNEWNIIRVEIWEDSGRIIVFPSKEKNPERIDISGTQIICKEIKSEVEILDNSSLSDQDYNNQINKIISKLAKLICESIPANSSYRFLVYNQNGENILAT